MPRMQVTFYFDVVCPYAYLASTRIEAIAARHGATVRWVPVLLGGLLRHVGGPDDPNTTLSAPRARLNLLDMQRWADRWGVPLTMPAGHPRRSVEAMRLLCAAPPATLPALASALFAAYWVHGRDITDRAVLAEVAAPFGLDAARVDAPEVKQALFDTTAEAAAAGAFGVPAFVVGDTLYWGQDRLHFVERALRGPAHVRFFHDFASPFSYLASTQIERVAQAHGATLEWSPILLGGLFRAIGTPDVPLFAMNAAKRRYLARDLDDWARHWGVPFRFPSHFPLRTITPLRVAVAEPAVTPHLYRAAWAEDRPIDDEAVLCAVLAAAGFDPRDLLDRAATPAVKAALRDNTEAAAAAGACGVPSFEARIGDHAPILLWGQDRLGLLADVLEGWRPRAG